MKSIKTFFLTLILSIPSFLHANEIRFQVLHTNDLHSHFEGTWSQSGKSVVRLGGYDRLLHQIKKKKSEALKRGEQTLTLDAGDFFAGTIFHALGPWSETELFPEWDFFREAGYDAVTLGNHEFDPGNRGVKTMFAKRQGGPAIVSTNIQFKAEEVIDNVLPYLSKKVRYANHEINVAILGILGPDGCLVSRGTRETVGFIGFDDKRSSQEWNELLDHLQEKIDEIKKTHQVIILIMHAGNPEDRKFAKSLSDIDLIIAGHTHRRYGEYINGVPISQTGSFGVGLGALEVSYDTVKDKLSVINPVSNWTIPIMSSDERDKNFSEKIILYKQLASKRFGMDPDEVIFSPTQDLIQSRELYNELGSFVTSNIRNLLNKKYQQNIDIYFTSMGLIRTSLYQGVSYTSADLFEMLSVGFDEKLRPGAKTSVFTLKPKDVETVIEFMELYSHFSNSFAPTFSSSIKFEVRKYGIPFVNRIYNITLHDKPLADYKRPIVVGTNMFVASNVDLIPQKTFGLISIEPMSLTGEIGPPKASDLPKEYELLIEALK